MKKYLEALLELINSEDEFIKKITEFLINFRAFKEVLFAELEDEEKFVLEYLEEKFSKLLNEVKLKNKAKNETSTSAKNNFQKQNIFKNVIGESSQNISASTPDATALEITKSSIERMYKSFVPQSEKATVQTLQSFLFAPLAPIALEIDDNYLPFISRISNKIKTAYSKLDENNPFKKTVESTNNGDPVQYLSDCISKPGQRMCKYGLLFKALSNEININNGFDNTTVEQANKLTETVNTITIITNGFKSLNNKSENNTQYSKRSATTFNKKYKQKTNPRIKLEFRKGNDTESIDVNDACFKLIAQVLQLTNYYCRTRIKGDDMTHTNSKTGWEEHAKLLANDMVKAYLKLPDNLHLGIIDIIKTHISKIKNMRGSNNSRLVGSLEELIKSDLDTEHQYNTAHLEITPKEQSPLEAVDYIQRHIQNQIFILMSDYKDYAAGNKPSYLEYKVYKRINKEIQALLDDKENLPHQESLRLQIIEIFQYNLHITGNSSAMFQQGQFGEMLKKVSIYLDQIKPHSTDNNTREKSSFEIITSPPGISFQASKTETNKLTSVLANNKTAAALCANVQRIYDFYLNTGLGALIADEINNGKPNSELKWKNEITELAQNITKMYFEGKSLAQMIERVNQTVTNMKDYLIYGKLANIFRNSYFSTNTGSRLAGSLEILANLYNGTGNADFYDDLKHLPLGVIKGINEQEAKRYIHKHVLQNTNRSFLKYYEIDHNRFFISTAKAKLSHSNCVTKELNQLYTDVDTIDIDNNFDSNFKGKLQNLRTNYLVEKNSSPIPFEDKHGEAINAANSYLCQIGLVKN